MQCYFFTSMKNNCNVSFVITIVTQVIAVLYLHKNPQTFQQGQQSYSLNNSFNIRYTAWPKRHTYFIELSLALIIAQICCSITIFIF